MTQIWSTNFTFVILTIVIYITSNLYTVSCSHKIHIGDVVALDLSSYNETNKTSHVFKQIISLNEGQGTVILNNVTQNDGFLIVQAHSFMLNVTLSNTSNFVPKTSIKGKNVGLFQNIDDKSYTFYVSSEKNISVVCLFVVVVYQKSDPIPGGCNLTFKTEVAPYQIVSFNDYLVKVDVQAASIRKHICEENVVHLDMYHLFLYKKSLDQDEYFQALQKMLTVEDIRKNGKKVPEPIGRSLLRRYYSAYRGTGSVYAVIAKFGNKTSAYVPAISYACDVLNWDENCIGPISETWKLLCALMLFLGIFTCYFGHRFFKTQMFIFGFLGGGFISYIATTIYNNVTLGQSLLVAVLFGFVYGSVWVIFWWKFGSPVLSVVLPVALTGFIIASTSFYGGLSDIQIFQNDINYWVVFVGIIIVTVMLCTGLTQYAHILACSVTGASAIIVSLDHYIGANLRYIVLNTIRRATVRNFKLAVIDPPYQYKDLALTVVWISLMLTGIWLQLVQQKGKPPFPPPPCGSRLNRQDSESTPLIIQSSPLYSEIY